MKRLLSFFLSVVMVFTMTSFSFASDSFSEKYTYPIEPGSEEWANLNHGERVLALQIPEDVLKGMSTENLVETVLNYPCFIDMMFYNTYQEGFDVIKEHFNGIDELLKRDDSSKYLLSKYRKQNTKTLLNIRSKEEQFESSLKLTYLETLLAQPEIIEKFSKKENEEVLELVNENYKLHIKNKNELPSLSFSGYYESLANQQKKMGNKFIPNIKTPNGSEVSVILRTDKDNAYIYRKGTKQMIEKNYPGAVVVGNATNKYNCHAFAWAGSKFVWMNDPSIYWEDGSYELEGHDSPDRIGQKIYYFYQFFFTCEYFSLYKIFLSSLWLLSTFPFLILFYG